MQVAERPVTAPKCQFFKSTFYARLVGREHLGVRCLQAAVFNPVSNCKKLTILQDSSEFSIGNLNIIDNLSAKQWNDMAGFHMDEALSLQDANSAAIQALGEDKGALRQP
jgi:hypothetical protein